MFLRRWGGRADLRRHAVEFRSAIQIPGHSVRALAVARYLAKYQPPKPEDPRSLAGA